MIFKSYVLIIKPFMRVIEAVISNLIVSIVFNLKLKFVKQTYITSPNWFVNRWMIISGHAY